jgi:hypothetical protein
MATSDGSADKKADWVIAFQATEFVLGVAMFVSSWIYFVLNFKTVQLNVFRKKISPLNYLDESEATSLNETNSLLPNKIVQLLGWLQLFVLYSMTLYHSILIVHRSLYGELQNPTSLSASASFIYSWTSNPYEGINMIPLDSLMIITMIPPFFSAVLHEASMLQMIVSWLIGSVSVVISCCVVGSASSAAAITFMEIISFALLVESNAEYTSLFLLYQKLKVTLEANAKFADQSKATEMRHMIANVAHDLKTVSPLFNFELFVYLQSLFYL